MPLARGAGANEVAEMAPARILTVLPDASHQRLARLLPAPWPVDRVSLAALQKTALPGTVIVADPDALGPARFRSLLDAAANAGAAVLLYTPIPTGSTVKLITDSTALELPVELVFFDAEDEADVLRRRIVQVGQASVPALVFRKLVGQIRNLQAELSPRVVALFGWVAIPEADQFLRGLSVGSRQANRWLVAAGLMTPDCLLTGARVARAFEWARAKPYANLDHIAAHCGFAKVSALDWACRRATGLAAGRALRRHDADDIATRVAFSLTR